MLRSLMAGLCVLAVIGAAACSSVRSAYDTTVNYFGTAQTEAAQEPILAKESRLAAAGFSRVPAKNEAELSHLRLLPPQELSYYLDNGRFRYRFADPDICRCVFVGDENAYQRYEQLRIAAEQDRADRNAAQIKREADQQAAMDSVNDLNPFRYNWF
jgi:hypothetical protein